MGYIYNMEKFKIGDKVIYKHTLATYNKAVIIATKSNHKKVEGLLPRKPEDGFDYLINVNHSDFENFRSVLECELSNIE